MVSRLLKVRHLFGSPNQVKPASGRFDTVLV